MNLWLVSHKGKQIKVVADGPAGAVFLANRDADMPIDSQVTLLQNNYDSVFRPRVLVRIKP